MQRYRNKNKFINFMVQTFNDISCELGNKAKICVEDIERQNLETLLDWCRDDFQYWTEDNFNHNLDLYNKLETIWEVLNYMLNDTPNQEMIEGYIDYWC